jgi:hypothetical protein
MRYDNGGEAPPPAISEWSSVSDRSESVMERVAGEESAACSEHAESFSRPNCDACKTKGDVA